MPLGYSASARSSWTRSRWFLVGFVVSAGLLILLAESFLRQFPMRDLHLYLGEESPLVGPFVPDPDFVVAYRSWDDFAAENEKRLAPHLPLKGHPDQRPMWAFFGNSFIQDHGALADSARARVSDRKVFNLGRIELPEIRLTQIKLLLEHGLKPERLFVELMPVDTIKMGPHPLATERVSRRGAITYIPALPAGTLGQVLGQSRLALTARVRLGMHKGNRKYNMVHLYQRVDEPLLGDLRHLFGSLARITRQKGIPTTILLLPDRNQLVEKTGFAFQDTMKPILREMGFDVFDPREAFVDHPDLKSLFMPCAHFNAAGNAILIDALLRHVQAHPLTERTASKEPRP